MDEKPVNPLDEAGLREYVDAEFTVGGLNSPAEEKALSDVLEKLSGLDKFSIRRGNLMVHYDPVFLSRKQLEEAIQGAGFRTSKGRAAASSPLTDALTEEN
ncbi:MAG: hypothetical protein DME70_04080, partial [Verrucomicrobia bacterium]